jgi:hypothetical protein
MEKKTRLIDWIEEHKNILIPQRNTILEFDLPARPWIYLRYMVEMSRIIESQFPGTKLLSPIVLRRSFIPKHITIDTNALVQLLMSTEDIKGFAKQYKIDHNIELNLKKANLGSSFKTIFGRDPIDDTEDFLYQQSYWNYLCRFDHYKNQINRKNGLTFGNSMSTDGCSVSLSLIFDKKKKKKKKRKVSKKKKKVSGEKIQDEFLETVPKNDTLYLSADPGKKDLVQITDGTNMIRYTRGQRNTDTKKKKYTEKSLRARRNIIIEGEYHGKDSILPGYYPIVIDPTLAYYEEVVMSKNSSKSCHFDTFIGWMKDKLHNENQQKACYEMPKFRNDRFSNYVLKKKSEDKFIKRLDEFVKKGRLKSSKHKSNDKIDSMIKKNVDKKKYSHVVMFYGNWGKNPNLKNNPPTPGIGLRRIIHKHIPTYTVNEAYTSKTCPCCKGITLENEILVGSTRHVSEKHHLLRCQNVNCLSRWWNRNCAGAYNIMYKGIEELDRI